MTIAKHVCTWTGFTGQPGYSVFYQNNSVGNPNPLQTFWAAIALYFPPVVTITTPATGELIDETTGKMTGVWGAGVQSAVVGTGLTSYVPNAGAQIKWGTGNFRNGRRVWGRTFLVPFAASQFGTGGVIASTATAAIQTAASTLITSFAGSMVIWTRPVYKPGALPDDPPVLVRAGALNPVVSATVPSKPATLSARRDV
jgi:hypothetical protein